VQTFLTPQFCTLQTEISCSNRSLTHLTAIKKCACDPKGGAPLHFLEGIQGVLGRGSLEKP